MNSVPAQNHIVHTAQACGFDDDHGNRGNCGCVKAHTSIIIAETEPLSRTKGPPVTITVRQLASLVRGNLVGDGDLIIHTARTIHDAQSGDLTFLEKKMGASLLAQSKAAVAIVPADFQLDGKTVIQVADPLMAFVTAFAYLKGKSPAQPSGIHQRATVDESACIGDDPSIHANAVIGANSVIGKRCQLHAGVVIGKNCRLGDDVVLYPNVVLYEDTILGDRVIIHANSVIGADGFGYRFHQGRHIKIPQLGNVVVGNDVEIGAATTIDRGTFQSTTIGDGTKIDNLVQIAHNCKIGKHNVFASQVGVAGSTDTGNYVSMGGQSGVKDHIHLGEGAMIGAKSGVIADVPPGGRVFLYPAHEEREAGRIVACLKKLPAMRKSLLRVLKELNLSEEADSPAAVRKAS
jgi:UDP-3-O-[3-hydroxymyristoyl] glucosamine N-acyltransferase